MKRTSSDPAMHAAFEHNQWMMDTAQLRYEGG